MKRLLVFLGCFFLSFSSFSQDDLLSFLDNENEDNLTFATFKSTKIINLQSIEQTNKKELNDAPHPRSIEAIKALAIKRGAESGFIMAEAFCIIRKLIE